MIYVVTLWLQWLHFCLRPAFQAPEKGKPPQMRPFYKMRGFPA
ncbi:hypothetical protein HMPREF9120_00623 [Neisseria sp. oral taxon 020 str. F0370]|nr:hypothetical protein HMPREF9120_00623 [Neisseria sp. oral taxon 020 str. F0370]